MAGTKKVKASGRPFVFLNHGLWSYIDEIKSAGWYVVFASGVAESARAGVIQGAPPPVAGRAVWSDDGRVLYVESPPDRYFDSHVWNAYGPNVGAPIADEERELTDDELADHDEDFQLTKREAQAFSDALDAWLIGVHERHPIALVVAWNGSRTDAWSKWSIEEVPSRVIPLLQKLEASARPASEETQREDSSEQLVARVTRAAIAAYFELHDPKKLEPTLHDAVVAVLRGAMGHGVQTDASLERLLRYLRKPAAPG